MGGRMGAWGPPALATLFACAGARIATFTVDKGLCSVFMICSVNVECAEDECACAEEK
jgi:hypothetical protein